MCSRVCCLILLGAVCTVTAQGQSDYLKWEGFLGYSYRGALVAEPIFVPTSTGFALQSRNGWESAHGWGLGVTRNLNKNIGLTADFEGQYGRALSPFSFGISVPEVAPREIHNFASYQLMFGPQISQRAGRLTHFAHALFGIYQTKGGNPVTDFAMAFGGGVDLSLSQRWAVRAIDVDFLREKRAVPWQNHVRIQTGIVFRFGR